jgi:hypothetical protein
VDGRELFRRKICRIDHRAVLEDGQRVGFREHAYLPTERRMIVRWMPRAPNVDRALNLVDCEAIHEFHSHGLVELVRARVECSLDGNRAERESRCLPARNVTTPPVGPHTCTVASAAKVTIG